MAINITGYFDNEGAQTGFFLPGTTTDDTSPLLQGTVDSLNSGDSIYILRDGMLLGRVNDINPATGTWSYQDSGLTNDGHAYTYQVWVLSAMGLPTAISGPCAITWSAGAPPPPPPPTTTLEAWDDKGPSTGRIDNNGTTDDDTPTLKGVLAAALTASQSVHIYRNNVDIGAANVPAGGTNWEYTDSGLVSGTTYTYTAKVVDQATGLTSASLGSVSFLFEAIGTQPTQTTTLHVWDDKDPVVGWVINGDTTNDDTPTLQGVLSAPLTAGQSLQVFRDGILLETIHPVGTDWSYSDYELTSGETYRYTAKVVNQAGQAGPESDSVSFTFVYNPSPAGIQIEGISNNDGVAIVPIYNNSYTNDNTPLLTIKIPPLNAGDTVVLVRDGTHEITLAIPPGATSFNYQESALDEGRHTYAARIVNAGVTELESDTWTFTVDTIAPDAKATISSIQDDTGESATDFITSDQTLLVNATLDKPVNAGEKVQISLDNGATWHDAASIGGNDYQYDARGTTLAAGAHTFKARVVDAAGNLGDATSQTVVIQTAAPQETATVTAITDDTGASATDFITNDQTLVISGAVSGALATGERVQVSLNGGTTWNFANVTGTVWTLDWMAHTLPEGNHTIQARVIDTAGNTGVMTSQVITIDITPPSPAKVTINPIAGNDVVDNGEARGNVTITGTLTDVPADAVSQELVVKVGGISHTPTLNGTTWSLTVPGSELVSATTGARGSVVASLVLKDLAGNVTNVTEDRGYMLHIEPSAAHTYTVGTAYAGLGYAMTAINDFNGDGYADYLVSAPGAHYSNLLGCGKSVMYLLYGSPSGLPNISDLDSLTAAQGIRITSTSTRSVGLQGMTVTDIGDFNGDGRSDVAISSNLNETTYILYGQAGSAIQTLDLNKLTASQGFSVTAACWAPASVTGADVNGDGYSDVIISNLDCGGKAYVIYGHAGAQGNITYTGTTVKGAAAYTVESGTNGLGTVLSAVGDVNGDGYTDFVATMPGNAAAGTKLAGSAYLIFGGPTGVSQPGTTQVNLDKMGSGKGITISASNYWEHLGGQAGAGGNTLNADAYKAEFHSVASLGNIDGSGRNAFAIGSPGASPSDSKSTTAYTSGSVSEGAGAVYVLYGQTNWSNITLPTWNSVSKLWTGGNLNGTNGFVIYSASFANLANGKQASAADLGFAVSSAGDVNGDGIDDFLIGAPAAYGGKGAAYVVFGEAGGLPGANTGVVNLDALVAAGKTSAFGAAGTAIEYIGTTTIAQQSKGGSNLGTDVTGGDFSGTGIHGYSFGAWGESNGTKVQAGAAYVYDGVTTFLTQPISNANGAVYYAGDGATVNGVDLIATGAGNAVWVHGIGIDTTGSASTAIQHDAVSGGKGSDFIGIVGANFTSINGGNGTDTLVFEASNIQISLAQMGLRVQSIEQFDLNNQTHTAAGDPRGLFNGLTHGNTLELRLSDVLNQMSDAPNSQRMTILGDNTSTVDLAEAGWTISGTQTVGGLAFNVYHNATMGANTVADLLIQAGVHVTH